MLLWVCMIVFTWISPVTVFCSRQIERVRTTATAVCAMRGCQCPCFRQQPRIVLSLPQQRVRKAVFLSLLLWAGCTVCSHERGDASEVLYGDRQERPLTSWNPECFSDDDVAEAIFRVVIATFATSCYCHWYLRRTKFDSVLKQTWDAKDISCLSLLPIEQQIWMLQLLWTSDKQHRQ